MKKINVILSISLISVLFVSCNNTNSSWTEQQRKEFEKQCTQTETFNNVLFQFKGFDDSEFDSIWVHEYKDSVLLDSFRIFVSPTQGTYEKENKQRYATIEKTMNLKNKYLFFVPGQLPYEFANMKMIMWPQFTNTSEGWGCVMGDYTIDGIRFEHNANPTLIKREN